MSPQLPPAGLPASQNPSPPRLPPIKPPRVIIENFDLSTYKIDLSQGYVEADCRHCGHTIKGQKNVTSNFIQHMRRRHPHAYELFSKTSTPRAKRPRLSNPFKAAIQNQTQTPHPVTSAANPPPTAALPAPPPPLNHTPSVPAASAAPIAVPIAPGANPQPSKPTPRPTPTQNAANLTPPNMLLELALVSATYRAALRTPCTFAPSLSHRTRCQFYLKREDQQITGSPIFRAAYNYLSTIPTARNGVLAVGPSALPVAAAAQKHGKSCVVVIPTNATQTVRRLLMSYGAKIENGSETLEECMATGAARAAEMHRTFVDVACGKLQRGAGDAIVGYATLGMEMLQQCPHVGRVFVRGGNAMLVKGVAAVLGRLGRGVKLVGVVMEHEAGGEWEGFVDEVVRVGWGEVCAAVGWVFEEGEGGGVLEWAGVLAVAGAVKYVREGGVTHERVVCVVDEPCRSWEAVGRMGRASWKGDGSRCWLWLTGKSGREAGLGGLMKELAGTVGGGVKVTGLRWRGDWPMLLGLKCDEEVTGVMHMGNLMALGYEVEDVTGRDVGVDEMWTWGDENEQGAEGAWAVFRVELWETTDAVLKFLSEERIGGEGIVRRVSFTEGERGLTRLLVGGWGAEWQLGELERSMREVAKGVRRIDGDVKGLVVLGIGGRRSQETSNGVVQMTCEGEAGNGDGTMEVAEEEVDGGEDGGVDIAIRFGEAEAGEMEVDGTEKRGGEVEMEDDAHMTHVEVEGEHGGIEGDGQQVHAGVSGENAVEHAADNEIEVQIEGHMEGGEGEEEDRIEGEEREVDVETVERAEKVEQQELEVEVGEDGEREGEGGDGGVDDGDGEVDEEVEDVHVVVDEGGHMEEEHLEEVEVGGGEEEDVHGHVEECEEVDDGHDCDGHEDGGGGADAGTGEGDMEIVEDEELEVRADGVESKKGEAPCTGSGSTKSELGLAPASALASVSASAPTVVESGSGSVPAEAGCGQEQGVGGC